MEERPDKEIQEDASEEITEEDLPVDDAELNELLAQDEPESGEVSDSTLPDGPEDETLVGSGDVPIDDEIGIPLNDDELWDEDGGLDEIPLFEDEFEDFNDEEKEEIGEDDSPPQTSPKASSTESPKTLDSSQSPDEESKAVKEDDTGQPPPSGEDKDAGPDDAGEETIPDESISWIGWLITAVSSLLIIAGGFFLYELYSMPQPVHELRELPKQPLRHKEAKPPAPSLPAAPAKPVADKKDTQEQKSEDAYSESGQWEVIPLSPFLIPAYQAGELVFFKVQVALTVPDIQTKRAVMRQEARVRNIIYQGLKGMEVQPGYGNVLYQYRRPLMDTLNRSLAPLKVLDLKLTGYLMK